MNIQKELVTPEKALKLLELNTKNRAVRLPAVLKFSREMSNGNWKEDTGELIKISSNNILIDGQHRLLAVVKSNKPIHFHIARGLNETISDVLDTGNVRSAADVFSLNHIMYSTSTPSIIQQYYVIKHTNGLTVGDRGRRLTNTELIQYYNENPEFWNDIAANTNRYYNLFSKVLNKSTIGGIYAILSEIDIDMANAFFIELCSGENITNKSISVLRKKLLDDRLSSKKITHLNKVVYIIKTWNFYRAGMEVSLLKYSAGVEDSIRPI